MPFLNPDGAALTIAAGIEAAAYADWLNGYPLMRAMPNTPAMVGMGVSGLWIPAGSPIRQRMQRDRCWQLQARS